MSPPRRLASILLACSALAAGLLLAACGEEEVEGHAEGGEALELGPLVYGVEISRFLNPSLLDDRAYLAGLEPPAPGHEYLGVFLRIDNETDQPHRVPASIEVVNARGVEEEPIEVENPFTLTLGTIVDADSSIPAPGTAAASGPIKGSMLLFEVEQADTEYRPLELEITPAGGETGTIELDI